MELEPVLQDPSRKGRKERELELSIASTRCMNHILGVGCDRWGTLYHQTHGSINDQLGKMRTTKK